MNNNKITICIDARCLNGKTTGINRYLYENLKVLINENNFNYILISNKKIYFDSLNYKNVLLIEDLKFSFIPGTIWLNIRLKKLIKRFKCNIFWGPEHILPFFKIKSIKYILTIHDLVHKILPLSMNNYNLIISKIFFKKSIINADYIICVSKTTKKDLLKYYPVSKKKNIFVIYEGKTLFLNEKQKRLIKEEYIFVLGSLEPRKNINFVLKIFPELKKYNKELKLVITGGKGWKYRNILTNIDNSDYKNDIILTGHISDNDIINYFQNAALFIFPSLYEGFGLPLIEAEGMCPVIANDIGIFRELSNNFKNLKLISMDIKQANIAIEVINNMLINKPKCLTFITDSKKIFTWENSAFETKKVFLYSMKQ